MSIQVNGREIEWLENETIKELLKRMKYTFPLVVVKIDNKVIDSRLSKDGRTIRRRRECLDCGRRFTTYERLEEILPMVIKKDGRRESFNREKIIEGIKK